MKARVNSQVYGEHLLGKELEVVREEMVQGIHWYDLKSELPSPYDGWRDRRIYSFRSDEVEIKEES